MQLCAAGACPDFVASARVRRQTPSPAQHRGHPASPERHAAPCSGGCGKACFSLDQTHYALTEFSF